MARERINVRQQQFGFPDEDLKTTLHDEIVLWLKSEKLELAKTITDWSGVWNAKWVEKQTVLLAKRIEERTSILKDVIAGLERAPQYRNDEKRLVLFRAELVSLESWTGPGDPGFPEIRVEAEMEVPIKRERYKSVDIVGYADLVLSVQRTRLTVCDFPQSEYGNFEPAEEFLEKCITWQKHWIEPRKIAFDAKSSIPSLGELIRQLRTYKEFCSWPFFIVSPDARFADQISDEGFGFIPYPEGKVVFPKRRRSSIR